MKKLILIVIPFFISCAAYKQLKPVPEPVSQEKGYVQLQDDGDPFELSEGKSYFIEFPAPVADNFYLLAEINGELKSHIKFASAFNSDDGPLDAIMDEAPEGAKEMAWPIDKHVQKFYLIIEKTPADQKLDLNYRYLPQWRYKFESQRDAFKELLEQDKTDRSVYDQIGKGFNPNAFDYDGTIQTLECRTADIISLYKQFTDIEKLFPAEILNSDDPAYQDFLDLKENIQIERTFQENYLNTLQVLKALNASTANMPGFSASVPMFLKFMQEKDRYSDNIVTEVKHQIDARLDELPPYYDNQIRKKNNYKAIDLNIDDISSLYAAIGRQQPQDYKTLAAFVKAYNRKSNAAQSLRKDIDALKNSVATTKSWPNNTFFSKALKKLRGYQAELPSAGFSAYGTYGKTKGARLLNSVIHGLHNEAIRLKDDYTRADEVVRELNRYAKTHNYTMMLKRLGQNGDLSFLRSIYSNLDNKYLTQQKQNIKAALKAQNWSAAENKLKGLFYQKNFINKRKSTPKRLKLVKSLEDSLINRVEQATRNRVDTFVKENFTKVNDVGALYSSPVFEPAWDITFTSGNARQLALRKQALVSRLTKLKEEVFPANAIKALYKDFTANINANGVMKARAIVIHGKHYKGKDKVIKKLVAECDPWASKWLTKNLEYRKVYALPITTNPTGVNTYVFRVNIRIPTKARFPVYDVSIKLPKSIGQAASNTSWYEKMTMNKKMLKPEGRFTITTPNASNNYTALLSPLSVEKNQDSVLEVRFKYKGFKVLEISLKAQKPILRKN